MQYLTPDPDEHSAEEVIRSYHEHQGNIDVRSSLAKIVAAIMSVQALAAAPLLKGRVSTVARRSGHGCGLACGGSISTCDRRIMLICGAADGMSAVFRAPLTGIVFALEMPYKDDLAHEALVPSLIASVVSYSTMSAFLGREPLFNFWASPVTPGTIFLVRAAGPADRACRHGVCH